MKCCEHQYRKDIMEQVMRQIEDLMEVAKHSEETLYGYNLYEENLMKVKIGVSRINIGRKY